MVYVLSDVDGVLVFVRMCVKWWEMIEVVEGLDVVVSVFGFDESNVVIFVGVKANAGGVDANDWVIIFGIMSV